MPKPSPGQRMTFETAAALDPDDAAGELDEGRFTPLPPSTWRHGEIVGNVCLALAAYTRAHPGWSLSVGDPGAKLRRDPDTLRGPDVGLVRAERRPTGKGAEGWLEGAPDLAVEVSGDAQGWSDLMRKALEYLAAGAQMVWLLDPDSRRVVVCTPPNSVNVLGEDDDLDGGEALPGFRSPVKALFE